MSYNIQYNSRILFFPADYIIILDFVVIVGKYCEQTKLVCTSVAPSSSSSSSSSLTPGGMVSFDDHKNIVRIERSQKENNDNSNK